MDDAVQRRTVASAAEAADLSDGDRLAVGNGDGIVLGTNVDDVRAALARTRENGG